MIEHHILCQWGLEPLECWRKTGFEKFLNETFISFTTFFYDWMRFYWQLLFNIYLTWFMDAPKTTLLHQEKRATKLSKTKRNYKFVKKFEVVRDLITKEVLAKKIREVGLCNFHRTTSRTSRKKKVFLNLRWFNLDTKTLVKSFTAGMK